ncbi:phosphomevalonate kinase [Friedmanniomyces endolithicus]|uniref:Phosphomevalonate kinase n=1 Tax=Friedmanniomyces endolithicus TaxID=329885 RepID=A0AAN6KSQ5_9PEZI|nr:phosphomevalonate kinase [Friedmanniomyces endolithicus]KAK0999274.1 phosphomevalonate kinase [Friedmanniomyces endolithicus]KAK1007326.1 phosphomevalonate kinase [Friedmanniomyces endolithicus]
MVRNAVAVSAPGKVLLAGGYLVLDREYTGLVFGLDARIHVNVQAIPTSSGVTLNEIVVQSPQFQDAAWEYGYRLAERDGGMSVTPLRVPGAYLRRLRSYSDADLNLNRNVFIETTVSYALSYVASLSSPMISPASVTILADNDYYSTPASLASRSDPVPRFHNFDVPISKAHKTGLGSSAALVTALTGALLTYYLPREIYDITTNLGKRQLHNLAQAAHCAAQGKVGSGFDVASAVYGSCIYRRFSPSILTSQVEPGKHHFSSQLRDIVNESGDSGKWDYEILKEGVKVPKGLRLVMCDVSCGSQTPGMVKQVLAWRKAKPAEANEIWTELHHNNIALVGDLKSAAEIAENNPARRYAEITKRFHSIRALIRTMSEKSGVPIEPPEQTELLDACENIPGFVGGVVPGAGGYDAVALLIQDDEDVIARLQSLLAGWTFRNGENGVAGGRVSMLGVREEMEGVRVEEVGQYREWLA